ncbi:MAG: hypothetical protein IJD57_04935 [Candidatus Gastranaerophilales bacterium]|nr:hypothetical protein [Candidatus Gastranaerophilales bacterium]
MTKQPSDTVPVEVCIITKDHEIKGTVYVSKFTKSNRELTELLNDTERRFLAVTNAEIIGQGTSSTPRRYDFLEIHIDSIIIMHPASQALFKETSKAQEDIAKFRELRNRLSQTKPF